MSVFQPISEDVQSFLYILYVCKDFSRWNLRPTVAHAIKRDPKQSWLLDFTPWNPEFRYWIPDLCQCNLESWFQSEWDSGFLERYSEFKLKASIPDSKGKKFPGFRNKDSITITCSEVTMKIHPHLTYTVSQINCFPCLYPVVTLVPKYIENQIISAVNF